MDELGKVIVDGHEFDITLFYLKDQKFFIRCRTDHARARSFQAYRTSFIAPDGTCCMDCEVLLQIPKVDGAVTIDFPIEVEWTGVISEGICKLNFVNHDPPPKESYP